MNSVANNGAGAGLIDLRSIIQLVRRRLLPILAAVALVLVLTIIAYSMQEPRYEATARVAVERQQTGELVPANNTPNITADSSTVDTEVQVLTSPSIAASVVDELGLARRPGFGLPQDGTSTRPDLARARAIDAVRGGLKVQREGVSYAISISYASSDPKLAADIVNATVDAYLNGRRGAKSAQREREIQQLRDRLGQLRTDVIQAESAVARYRADTSLVDLQNENAAAQGALSTMNTQLAQARAEAAAAQARAAASQGGASSIESPVVRELRAQQARLSAQLSDLSERYGENHPARQAVQLQLTEINRQVGQEIARVRAANSAEARIASERVASIQGSINQAQGRLIAGNNASPRLFELEREAESARGLYQAFLDRYRQSVAAQGTERSNAYPIALATVPRGPTSPSLPVFAIGGIVAALLVAALVVLLLELMENGFRTRSDVEKRLDVPVIASVPDLRTVREAGYSRGSPLKIADYLVENEGSLFAEAFRSVRTALRIGQEGQKARSLAITSSLPGEGKTTVAICLARSLARSGLRVVLVDCDARRRATSRNLSDGLEAGLVDVLKGDASLEKALVRDSASGAYLLPQRPTSPNDYDLIVSREMEQLVKLLTQEFDVVVLDTAPTIPVAESRAVASMADATLLVVQWRTTAAPVAEMALRELEVNGAKVVGTVLSQVDIRKRSGVGEDAHYYRAYEEVTA